MDAGRVQRLSFGRSIGARSGGDYLVAVMEHDTAVQSDKLLQEIAEMACAGLNRMSLDTTNLAVAGPQLLALLQFMVQK